MSRPDEYGSRLIMLPDDGTFPNNPRLPLLVYPGAFLPFGPDPAGDAEARFNTNGWPAAWRNGVYARHHYHSEAHEALDVAVLGTLAVFWRVKWLAGALLVPYGLWLAFATVLNLVIWRLNT